MNTPAGELRNATMNPKNKNKFVPYVNNSSSSKKPVNNLSRNVNNNVNNNQPSGVTTTSINSSRASINSSNNRSQNTNKSKFFPSVPTYPNTSRYLRYLSDTPRTLKALNNANNWIIVNRKTIDPISIFVCADCGRDDMTICECILPKPKSNVYQDKEGNSIKSSFEKNIFGKSSLFGVDDTIDIRGISQKCKNFDNECIPDSLIDIKMYNYIKIQMSSRYSSFEDREEHVRKLCLKYLEKCNVDLTNLTSTQNSIILITRQKVRDQYEIEVLMKENRPETKEVSFFLRMFNFFRACFLIMLNVSLYLTYAITTCIIMYVLMELTDFILPGFLYNILSVVMELLWRN